MIIFHCLLLIKLQKDQQIFHIFVILMGIVVFIKFLFIPKTKLRLFLLVHIVLLLLGVCLFGLCNAPVAFQRCMFSIFSDLIDDCVEVFMDDFSVYGSNFKNCLENISKVLDRCMKHGLVLNWEKGHFIAQERIVLGNIVS